MEMRIRENNGAFKVTVTSLAGQELAVYREGLGSLTFELREVEEEYFERWEVKEIYAAEEVEDFKLERVPMFKAEEKTVAAQIEVAQENVTQKETATVPTQEEVLNEEAAAVMQEVREVARNNALFHKLSGLRRELASAAKVPPYLIFHDKTLWSMVEKMPVDLPALSNISGVGKSKLEKYGETFLSALNECA